MKLEQIGKEIIYKISPTNIYNDSFSLDGGVLSFLDNSYNLNDFSQINIVGAGKAAALSVQALYQFLEQDNSVKEKTTKGLVCTKYFHGIQSNYFDVIEAAHPVCDDNSLLAARSLQEHVSHLSEDCLLIVCLSGGASAILALPIDEFDLSFKQNVASDLLKNGAPIEEMNRIRRELSLIKNGGLAASCGCRNILVLSISDIPSNDVGMIGSGPCHFEYLDKDVLIQICQKYLSSTIRDKIINYLNSDQRQKRLSNRAAQLSRKKIDHHIISDFYSLIDTAKKYLSSIGENSVISVDEVQIGDVKDGIESHILLLKKMIKQGKGRYLISGGEYTVNVTGDGVGGRNLEFVLLLTKKIFKENCLQLDKLQLRKISFCSLGTDGTDGPTIYAGSYMDYEAYLKSVQLGLDLEDFLQRNDSLNFFEPLGTAIKTGPTNTNIMDLRMICFDQE